jgi:hypothetical protein
MAAPAPTDYIGLWWQLLTVLASTCAFATPVMYLEGARYRGLRIIDRIRSLILLTVGGYGISISNMLNYLDALFGRVGEFRRTPKYSLNEKGSVKLSFGHYFHVPVQFFPKRV